MLEGKEQAVRDKAAHTFHGTLAGQIFENQLFSLSKKVVVMVNRLQVYVTHTYLALSSAGLHVTHTYVPSFSQSSKVFISTCKCQVF